MESRCGAVVSTTKGRYAQLSSQNQRVGGSIPSRRTKMQVTGLQAGGPPTRRAATHVSFTQSPFIHTFGWSPHLMRSSPASLSASATRASTTLQQLSPRCRLARKCQPGCPERISTATSSEETLAKRRARCPFRPNRALRMIALMRQIAQRTAREAVLQRCLVAAMSTTRKGLMVNAIRLSFSGTTCTR